ncbi:MAG: hypothetical protein ACOC56_01880 [Atribacterota bacterium]
MTEIKVFHESEKLNEAYDIFTENIDDLVQKYNLTYFELFGLIEALKSDLIKSQLEEE